MAWKRWWKVPMGRLFTMEGNMIEVLLYADEWAILGDEIVAWIA